MSGHSAARCPRAAELFVVGALILAATTPGPPARAQAPAAQPPAASGQTPAQATNPAAPNPATPTQEAAPPPGSTSPAFRPGFIDALGRWLEDGVGRVKSGVQDAQEKIDRLNSQARDVAKDVAKDATGAMTALPNARARSGRERCMPAANGAPDCQAAAVALCRGGGFAGGKSLDTQSEQKCSGKFLLEGRSPTSADCPTEIFVTRAMCQ